MKLITALVLSAAFAAPALACPDHDNKTAEHKASKDQDATSKATDAKEQKADKAKDDKAAKPADKSAPKSGDKVTTNDR